MNLRRVNWGWLTEHQDRITPPPKPTTIPSSNLPTVQQDPNIPTLIAEFQALIAELINQLQETKRTPARAHTEAASCAVVVTGLSPGEAETATDAVKTLITDTLRLPENITQGIQEVLPVAATREVKEGEQLRPSKIIIRFATPSTINPFLRVASRLKEENCRRKAAREFVIGIDREQTGEDRNRRNALWPQFRCAKTAGQQ